MTRQSRDVSAREAVADAREAAADAREAAADAREVIVDARVAIAEARQSTADTRERQADSRESQADDRQDVADGREARADERQVIADDRETRIDATVADVTACIGDATALMADAEMRLESARMRLATAQLHMETVAAREDEALALRQTADQQMADAAALLADAKRIERLLVQKLTAREELLTTMVAQQLRVRESERRRIANNLHDSALQHSVAALMVLDLVPVDDPAVREHVEMVRAEVELVLQTTREVMQGLDPLDLGEMTFEAAVRAIASDLQARFGIPIEVTAELGGPVDDIGGAALCRMVREALVNAVKHAEAAELRISLGDDPTHTWATVRDNGRGIEAASGDGSDQTGARLGLAFLQERATSLDGSLEITSDAGGTTVRMSVPRQTAGRSLGLNVDADRAGDPDAAVD